MKDTQSKNNKEKNASKYLLADLASCTFTFSDGLSSKVKLPSDKEIVLVKLIPHTTKSKEFEKNVLRSYIYAKNMNELAKLCGYSCIKTFTRHFKKYFGQTPYQWMLDRKMEEIDFLVKNTELTITEIAEMYGFKSLSHLVNFFSKRNGIPPHKSRSTEDT